MTIARQQLGQAGETIAARYLQDNGYIISECNYRNTFGEIDIVAQDGVTLCFVEVKTRQDLDALSALESITPRKQRQISRVALAYLKAQGSVDVEARFDVLAIYEDATQTAQFELIKDAFELPEY